MFTTAERDEVLARVLELAQADPRVTAGALIGSMSVGAEDDRSDIDITFGIADHASPEAVLDEWTAVFARDFGTLHHFDLLSGAAIYRVFLLPSGLELDVSVAPQQEFGARGPRFRTLFGTSRQLDPAPQPAAQHVIGLCWHHILHARSCIERGKPWQAEYWISALRDYTLALACLRLGEDAVYARGVDRLPAAATDPLADALVRSLDAAELRRALAAATTCFTRELESQDAALSVRLEPILREFGAPVPVAEHEPAVRPEAEPQDSGSVSWQIFATAAPELAAFVKEQFAPGRVAMVGTIRADGSPRISSIEPSIVDGELYLGMMWQSRKALDLLRDPRIVLRNAVCTSIGDEVEISLRGHAVEIHDPDVRRRYVAAVAERISWHEPHFHLFAVQIARAALVQYAAGEQTVKLWPQDVQFTRPYS
jgi:hypothetical protein